MNKNDLIDSIASGSGLSKADSGRALEAFIGAVTSVALSIDFSLVFRSSNP